MFDAFEEREFSEEELVREAADFPSLSAELRNRVIGSVVRAHTNRAIRRHFVCLLLCVVSLTSWIRIPFSAGADDGHVRQKATADSQADGRIRASTALIDGPVALMARSEIGNWGHVEAVIEWRKVHVQALRGLAGFY